MTQMNADEMPDSQSTRLAAGAAVPSDSDVHLCQSASSVVSSFRLSRGSNQESEMPMQKKEPQMTQMNADGGKKPLNNCGWVE